MVKKLDKDHALPPLTRERPPGRGPGATPAGGRLWPRAARPSRRGTPAPARTSGAPASPACRAASQVESQEFKNSPGFQGKEGIKFCHLATMDKT